jgi:hypothetical protein
VHAQVSNAVTSTFRTVSIEDAKCSSEADKEKILAIIESSFISLKAFDRHISNLLTEVTNRLPTPRPSHITALSRLCLPFGVRST